MKKYTILYITFSLIIAVIIAVAIADWLGGNYFFIFYQLVYGLILSIAIPIGVVKYKEKETIASLGVKTLGLRQIVVLFIFAVFSIGGQIRHIDFQFNLFVISIAPLVMTTFFEEFLFRGFMQTRIEKAYGPVVAVILSGFVFGIYHLGYSGFRTFEDILQLVLVGIMFALAFKLADNNVIVSYFINLPNAFLNYMLKSKQFPYFDFKVTIISIVTIAMIAGVLMINFSSMFTKSSYLTVESKNTGEKYGY